MNNQAFYVGVKAVIVKDSKVLVLKRITKAGREIWDMPGGRLQENESFKDGLHRELQEELPGISNIQVGEFLFVKKIEHVFEDGAGLVLISYSVTAELPTEVQISDEHIECRWLTKADIEEIEQNKDIDFATEPLLKALEL